MDQRSPTINVLGCDSLLSARRLLEIRPHRFLIGHLVVFFPFQLARLVKYGPTDSMGWTGPTSLSVFSLQPFLIGGSNF
jgi:hypothetical protein